MNREPSGRSAPKTASVFPPSPAAGTRSGISCASAPCTASSARKPVTPRIDDAPLDPVGVEVVGERCRPVGPCRELPADEPLGVLDEPGHQLGEALRAVT